jgi:hypothetical protein
MWGSRQDVMYLMNRLTLATGAANSIQTSCQALCHAKGVIRHAHKFTEHTALNYEIIDHQVPAIFYFTQYFAKYPLNTQSNLNV